MTITERKKFFMLIALYYMLYIYAHVYLFIQLHLFTYLSFMERVMRVDEDQSYD